MPTILRTEVKDDSWSTFLRAEIRLDDGTTYWRQIEDHGVAVSVLPYDVERACVLLVKLFRAPPLYTGRDPLIVESLAGLIDAGEGAEEAARREAMEEVGVRLSTLEPLGEVWSSPGVSTERMSLFLAPYREADRVAPGGGLEAEREDITVMEVPCAEMGRRLEAGTLGDMKLVLLVQALKLRHPALFG